jgi:hypothetical protein
MDVESEIRDLKRRVGKLEGGFGFLTQVRTVHLDLLGFQSQTIARFDGVDGRLGRVEKDIREVKADVAGLKSDVAGLKTEVSGLRSDLPSIVGDVMREVLREQKR